jgi:HlyD family secretion protein
LETYELKAPFDGVITKLDYQVWDNLIQNDEKYILLENPDILEVDIFVDQVDIMKLSVWQKAIITYDTFPWKEFNAEVIEIDSTPQDKDWVTKYGVKVFLENQKQTIFSWMNAKVNIMIQKRSWVLSVPFMAINTDQQTWEEFVVILNNNWQKEKRKVKVGYSDWVNTEIVEWLKEWEKVLQIDYDSNTYTSEDFEESDASNLY